MKNLVPILLTTFCIQACGDSTEATDDSEFSAELPTVIAPPLEGDFQNDTVFAIDPTKPTEIELANGTSIEIPANILVDEKGKAVKKEVEISFTQYHSTADIIASGIPMEYDSSGTEFHFESAGMFSIDARSKKKKVQVKEGEQIKINLASDKNSKMNFYQLNEQTGDWTYDPAPTTPIPNPRFQRGSFPLKPQPRNVNAFVLDLDLDLSDFDELSMFNGIVWEYCGDHDSLDPRKNPDVSATQWTDFDLEPTYDEAYEYWLKMNRNNKKTFTTKVKAALQGEDFEAALKQYQEKKIEIADKRDQMKKPFIRSVAISGFGTFNCDAVDQLEEPQRIMADFDFQNAADDGAVFVMYPDEDIVYNFYTKPWGGFAVDKAKECHVLAILPGNELYAYKGDLSDCYGKESYTFKMTKIGENLTKKADLEKAVAAL